MLEQALTSNPLEPWAVFETPKQGVCLWDVVKVRSFDDDEVDLDDPLRVYK